MKKYLIIAVLVIALTIIAYIYHTSNLVRYESHIAGTRIVTTSDSDQKADNKTIITELPQTYYNEKIGFKIDHPKDWTTKVEVEYFKPDNLTKVLFSSPNNNQKEALSIKLLPKYNIQELSIGAWYNLYVSNVPSAASNNVSETVINNEPAIILNNKESYTIYTRINHFDILEISFPKNINDILYKKMISTIKLNINNFGIVSFTEKLDVTNNTFWRVVLKEENYRNNKFQIISRLVPSDLPTNMSKKDIEEDFIYKVLVTSDEMQKNSGGPIHFTFTFDWQKVEANSEGPRLFSYIKPIFGFIRHHTRDDLTGQETRPLATTASIPMLGDKIIKIDYKKSGDLISNELILATVLITDKKNQYRYELVLSPVTKK